MQKQTQLEWILRKHLVQAYINALYEDGRRVYVCFVVNHPQTVLHPHPGTHKLHSCEATAVKDARPQLLGLQTITLNLSAGAINNYVTTETGIEVQCRFGGVLTDVVIPYTSVAVVYDPDDTDKAVFNLTPILDALATKEPKPTPRYDQPTPGEHTRPKLTIVK